MELTRRDLIKGSAGMLGLRACEPWHPRPARDPLPSWNEGPAKHAIIDFVRDHHRPKAVPKFVPPEDRIATFDQDGTTWVEHPIYSQVVFALDRVAALRRSIRNGKRRSLSSPC